MDATVQHFSNRASNLGAGDFVYVDRRKSDSNINGSFSDPRVVLVTAFDDRVAAPAGVYSERCQAQQGEDGPTYLVIGPSVTDRSLERASEKFGIPLEDLMAFRAAQEDATKLPIWRPVVEVVRPDGEHEFEILGEPMPKRKAWEIAGAAMDNRNDVVCMLARLDRS